MHLNQRDLLVGCAVLGVLVVVYQLGAHSVSSFEVRSGTPDVHARLRTLPPVPPRKGSAHSSPTRVRGKLRNNEGVNEETGGVVMTGSSQPVSPDLLRAWSGAATATELSEYFGEAQRNLTAWKRNLFGVTAKTFARQLHDNGVEIYTLFDLLDPVVRCPPGTQLSSIGPESSDGSKWSCGVAELKEPCVVLSLGSNGQYEFEESILATTPCRVFTFDCTMKSRQHLLKNLGPRHENHLKCLGSEAKARQDADFVTLPQAMRLIDVKRVDLFKMDIEGFEYDVMATWGTEEESGLDYNYLPMQVLFEVHVKSLYAGTSFVGTRDISNLMYPAAKYVTLPELALFFNHLADLGYAVAVQEKNHLCPACSEFVLLRVK